MNRYPATHFDVCDDEESIQLHKRTIDEELLKKKPRDSVLRPLLKATFTERRMFIQNQASSVAETLQRYPALFRAAIVSQK
jgi:hypothetical protein